VTVHVTVDDVGSVASQRKAESTQNTGACDRRVPVFAFVWLNKSRQSCSLTNASSRNRHCPYRILRWKIQGVNQTDRSPLG